MLTRPMLYALLHGLPADHLDHLDRPWYLLAWRIERNLQAGQAPVEALHSAMSNSTEWERKVYLRAMLHEEPVLALPGLTQRQKEALIALRYAGACSLSQLSRVLAQDRGNTHRRLAVLVEKGYAVKYFRRDGPYYLAISSPFSGETESQVNELMQAFKQALIAETSEQQSQKGAGPKSAAPTTPHPSTTTTTKGTKSTDAATATKPTNDSD